MIEKLVVEVICDLNILENGHFLVIKFENMMFVIDDGWL